MFYMSLTRTWANQWATRVNVKAHELTTKPQLHSYVFQIDLRALSKGTEVFNLVLFLGVQEQDRAWLGKLWYKSVCGIEVYISRKITTTKKDDQNALLSLSFHISVRLSLQDVFICFPLSLLWSIGCTSVALVCSHITSQGERVSCSKKRELQRVCGSRQRK